MLEATARRVANFAVSRAVIRADNGLRLVAPEMAGQFIGASNTCHLIYFSFLRDVRLYSFTMSGTGIEWGFLCLTLSWILKHAQLVLEEQRLVI